MIVLVVASLTFAAGFLLGTILGYGKGATDTMEIVERVREDFRERIELAAKQITLGMTDEQITARAKESTDAR